jgi:putative restriction endonuclease
LKDEFLNVFQNAKGEFSIEYGVDLNHFIFTPINTDNDYFDDKNEFEEGRVAYRNHRIRECNPKVVGMAKTLFKGNHHGRIYCEVCGFDFYQIYGELGDGYIEGHHVIPISELNEGDKTRVEDIVMLCANCHRIIHQNAKLTLEELEIIIDEN